LIFLKKEGKNMAEGHALAVFIDFENLARFGAKR
jgi:hypothetical protein